MEFYKKQIMVVLLSEKYMIFYYVYSRGYIHYEIRLPTQVIAKFHATSRMNCVLVDLRSRQRSQQPRWFSKVPTDPTSDLKNNLAGCYPVPKMEKEASAKKGRQLKKDTHAKSIIISFPIPSRHSSVWVYVPWSDKCHHLITKDPQGKSKCQITKWRWAT